MSRRVDLTAGHGLPLPSPRAVAETADDPVSGPALKGVRGLARQVLSPGVAGLVHDVPIPQLLSAQLKGADRAAQDYVLWWIRHPDAGSRFEAKTRWLRRLPRPWLMRVLATLGYDGFVYRNGEAIIGHVFFQRRRQALHGFSVAVNPAVDGAGFSVVMVLDFVAYGARSIGIRATRIGTGRSSTTRRLLARLKAREDELNWRVRPDGWITYSPDPM
jgi:hypothetical protein